MSLAIDCSLAPHSPRIFLGHARFTQIAKTAGAGAQRRPMDLGRVGAVGRARWIEERDIADAGERVALPAAIDASVFDAPGCVIDGEIFRGQDRLDIVQRRLARG